MREECSRYWSSRSDVCDSREEIRFSKSPDVLPSRASIRPLASSPMASASSAVLFAALAERATFAALARTNESATTANTSSNAFLFSGLLKLSPLTTTAAMFLLGLTPELSRAAKRRRLGRTVSKQSRSTHLYLPAPSCWKGKFRKSCHRCRWQCCFLWPRNRLLRRNLH